MKLPRGDEAIVALQKLTDYLLSVAHPVGSSKAGFFRNRGFDDDNVRLLEDGLLAIARSAVVAEVASSPHGTKYVIDGRLQTPDGGVVFVRTIWIIESHQDRPRFVTAYPK
ncbi:MAG: DUF6883 domain-containing protein [Thermoguttaceae bacterium]|jgi:hypothetical protein